MDEQSHDKINMKPLVEVLATVERMGFTAQFRAENDGLRSMQTQKLYQPEQAKVVHFYRFEGESNQDDNTILYAIEADGEKGTLVDAYGSDSDTAVDDFIRQVEGIHK
jgi:hypothetical protein